MIEKSTAHQMNTVINQFGVIVNNERFNYANGKHHCVIHLHQIFVQHQYLRFIPLLSG